MEQKKEQNVPAEEVLENNADKNNLDKETVTGSPAEGKDAGVDSFETAEDTGVKPGRSLKFNRPLTFADGGLIFSLIIISYLLINIVAVIASQGTGDTEKATSLTTTLILTTIVELCMLAVWYLYIRKRNIEFKQTRVNKDLSLTKVLKAVVLIVALFGFAILIEYVLTVFFDAIGYKYSEFNITYKSQVFIIMPVVTLLPAVCEEFVFRGAILPSLEKLGKWPAILISAGLFAIMHMNIGQTVYQFLLGVVLGYLVITFRTIWVGVIGHLLSNLMAMLRMISSIYGFASVMNIVMLVLSGVCVIAVIVHIIFNSKSPQNIAPPAVLTIDELEGAKAPAEVVGTALPRPDKNKDRQLIFLSYFAGIGVSILLWIVDLVTKLR